MCDCKWEISTDKNGEPDFRTNRQMSKEPLVRATCYLCGARTWFTKTQMQQATEAD